MTKPKLTPWFQPEIKPVHVGWYDCSYCVAGGRRHWWDGVEWKNSPETYALVGSPIRWRGLARKPK